MLTSTNKIAAVIPPEVSEVANYGSLETVLLLLGSSGATGVVVALVGLLANKKRVTAEATNQISQAAGAIVDRLEKENERISNENVGLRNRIADLELAESKYLQELERLRAPPG